MAKIGDVKKCRMCGEDAVLRLVPESTGGFVGAGGALPPIVPAHHAYVCAECGDSVLFNGPIEE
jgi:hypothetical protein